MCPDAGNPDDYVQTAETEPGKTEFMWLAKGRTCKCCVELPRAFTRHFRIEKHNTFPRSYFALNAVNA